MIVIVDERELVKKGYESLFQREGFSSVGFKADDFANWVDQAADDDISAVSAFLIGDTADTKLPAGRLKDKTDAPVIALLDQSSLEDTLKLFETGVDDVVRKPVHVREILARISAIRRRGAPKSKSVDIDGLRILFDGRDPEIDGKPFPLPRRERRILEYLASIGDRRATKSQVFAAIYGVFEPEIEENVIESHISKLRKKLRATLGFDPIDSKRFLGYRLVSRAQSYAECA